MKNFTNYESNVSGLTRVCLGFVSGLSRFSLGEVAEKCSRYAAMIAVLLTFSCVQAWGTQTSLISGVTLPDIPSSVLNMETQEDFTPASNWIVFNPYTDASSKSWMSQNSEGHSSASPSAPSGCVAPFVSLSSKQCYNVRQATRTYAIRFSKATDISFLVCSGGSRSVLVSLYEYDGSSKQDSITTKSESNNTVTELYFDELDLTKEYIAYIYENSSSNGWLYEIAVKRAGPGPYSVTYDKNGGTGTMSDASSPYVKNTTVTTLANTFTAPTGKTFTGWNTRADGTGTSYAAGATFTAVKDVKLYAQWAYPATGTGTITYTLTNGSDAVSGSVSGVSTISGFASAFTKSILTIGTTSQTGYCGNIGAIPAEESSTYYVDLPFTVASGYTFNPTAVSVKVNPLSGTSYMKVKVSILDNSLTVTSSELSCAKSTDNLVTFASGAFTDKLFTGTVHIRVYLYCATSGKYAYIKSPVTISGTVAAEASCEELDAPTGLTCADEGYNSLSFNWNAVTNASSYDIKLWTNSACTGDPAKSANTTGTTYRVRDLDSETTYYCKVQTKGDGSTYCESSGITAAVSATTNVGTRTFKSKELIYFKDVTLTSTGSSQTWKASGSNVHAYFFAEVGGSDPEWSDYGNPVSGEWDASGTIYEIEVPGEGLTFGKVIFANEEGWSKKQTTDQFPDVGQNMFVLQDQKDATETSKWVGYWSKYAKTQALVGDFNDWDPDQGKFVDGRVILDLAANTGYEFKVLVGDGSINTNYWSCSECSQATNTVDPWQQLYSNQNNWSLRSGEAGEYCFHWNNDTHYLGIYYPQARLTKGKYIYFDARDNTSWTGNGDDARFWFKYYDSNSNYPDDVTDYTCTKANATDTWVYPYVVPASDYIGQVQVNRYKNSAWAADVDKIQAYTRTSSLQNCIKMASGSSSAVSWGTYCPPMSSVTLTHNAGTTTTYGGTGAKATPYIVEVSTSINVSASSSSSVADGNMTAKYNFKDVTASKQDGEGTTFTLTASSTDNTTHKVNVDAYNYYNSTSSTVLGSDTIYYLAKTIYAITYKCGSKSTGDDIVDHKIHGTNITLRGNTTFSREGYNLVGWATTDDGDEAHDVGATYSTNAALTLYPVWEAKTTTVTLNANTVNHGSGDNQSVTATYDAALPSFTHTTAATGYHLVGYYTGATDGTEIIDEDGNFTSNSGIWNRTDGSTLTLYAHYEINTYTVNFASNNDSYGTVDVASITGVTHGSTVSIASNVLTLKATNVTATKTTDGADYTYAFSGWSVDNGDAITDNTTITATFTRTANSYDVTLSYDGDEVSKKTGSTGTDAATYGTDYVATFQAKSGFTLQSDVTVTIGESTATKGTEYTWSVSEGVGTLTVGGSYITDDIEVAVEADAAVTTYSVTYAAGVTLTSGSVPTDATAYDGDGTESVTVAGNTGSMVYTGYTFRGWTYNSTFYEAGNTFTMPASNVTLTAVWDEITSVNYYYGIIHITAGALTKGTTDTQTFFTNTSGTIATSSAVSISSAPSSTDYYYESNDLSGTELAKSSNWNTSSTSNRYMRALKFKSGDTYTLALGSNVATSITFYGKCGSASKTLTIGGQEWTSSSTKNTHESHAFTKSGDFTGNVSMVCGGDFYGIIIIACTGSSNYTVSFSDGETAPASHSDWPSNIVGVPSGVKVLEPTTDPSATGYTFGGWYTNAKCTTEVDWSSNITADKIVYAKWTAKTTSITLDANTSNHGSGANKSASVSYDATALTSITHTTPATGYALDGYYTTATDDPTTGVKIINADGSLVKTTTYTTNDDTPKWKSELSALTLYARYVTAYQVTYNDNGKTGGGAAPSDATYYAPGAEVTVAGNTNSMTKTNCVFMGWNTAADGTGTTYTGGEKMTMPSENTTLYALWGVSLTWNVQVNVGETTVTTTSTASSYTTHVANPGDLALNDLTVTSDKRSDATNKISTTKDKGGYVSATFAVATGYQFTPTHMILKTTATTEAKTVEVNVGSESQTWNQSASSSASPSSHTYKFEDASAITGTGTMKIYVYGGKDGTKGYRLGTPITVYGKVEPCTYTITYKDKGNVDFSGSHTDSPSAHPTSHTYGSATTLNSATKTGYTFGGWYTSSDCSTGLVTSLGATDYTANITLYAKWTPVTLTFLGNGSGVKWDWKDATNWSPACVPTIDHDVIIQKPVEVSMYGAGNIAKAKSIVIDKYGDNTGRLVIKGPYGLVVKETIQKKNEDGDLVAPESADLRIESTSYFENGALAIKGFTEASEKDINATVIYYTTSRVFGFSVEGEYIGFYVNQFIGTPLRTSSLYDYYGCWIYKWDPTADDGKGDWVYQSTAMTPFQGYDILNEYPSSPSFWLTGPLVYSEDQEFDLTYTGSGGVNGSENMFANSWMAPIDVTKFKTTDFAGGDDTKMEATIYVFNSGTPNNWKDKTEDLGTDPGQYLCMAVNSGSYTGGISEIQSMQAFSVYAKAEGAKLTLDYDSLVYEPLLKRTTAINPMRAPRRAKAESEKDDPEVMRIRVAGDQSADKIHLLIRDDFSEGFDNGWDASKMFGESFAPQLYAITSTGKELTVNCTPDAEGTVVGFQKGDRDSVYTFSFEYDGMSVFYLNDLKEQTSTLISNESTYEFIAENGDAEARFIISATPIQQVPTGIEDVQGDNVQSAKVRKLILNDKLYIIRGGQMYDATGRMVK